MSTKLKENAAEDRYRVISIEKSDPPEGMTEGNWYRYVIGQGKSRIEGLRLGNLKSVREHVMGVAENLNERAHRGYSTFVSRTKK